MLEEAKLFGRNNSKNVLSMLDTLTQAYRGDYTDQLAAAAEQYRANAAANVSPALAASLLRPLLQTMCKSVIGRGDLSSDASMNFEIYKYFIDNAQRVLTRGITYGIPVAAAANVGNGQIIRLVKDQYNFNAENVFLDQKRFLCVADYQTGTQRGNELFQLVGQTPARDDLERSGSGLNTVVRASTTDDSLLFNASFTNFSGTAAAPTAITNWTATTTAGASITVSSSYCTFDSTNYFRLAPSDGATGYAIKLVASMRLEQKLSVRGTKLRPDRPYLLAVIWNASTYTAVGTLVARMGATNRTVTVTGASGWQVTLIPVTSGSLAQQSCWPRLFETDDMSISLDFVRTSGSLLIDDVLLLEGQPADGNCFHWAIPNSTATYVPHKFLDSFTYADIATSDSKINKWWYFAFNAYLPHASASAVTLTDPA